MTEPTPRRSEAELAAHIAADPYIRALLDEQREYLGRRDAAVRSDLNMSRGDAMRAAARVVLFVAALALAYVIGS